MEFLLMDDSKELPPGVTPEMLERFRNLISMDKECNWFYDGKPITHEKTLKVLNESLQRNAEGLLIVQVGNAWSYVRVEDTPYVVRAVRERGGEPPREIALILSDGTEEVLDPKTLAVGEAHVLYCKVKGGKEEARFLRPAYYQLAKYIEEKAGAFALVLLDGAHPLAERVKSSA